MATTYSLLSALMEQYGADGAENDATALRDLLMDARAWAESRDGDDSEVTFDAAVESSARHWSDEHPDDEGIVGEGEPAYAWDTGATIVPVYFVPAGEGIVDVLSVEGNDPIEYGVVREQAEVEYRVSAKTGPAITEDVMRAAAAQLGLDYGEVIPEDEEAEFDALCVSIARDRARGH